MLRLSSLFVGGALAVVNLLAQAENQKVALVIGNSNYINARLDNPANDAHDLGQALKSLGFDVIEKIDLKPEEFAQALKDFGRRQQKGGTAVFYYAGHGVQIDGVNYLLPVGPDYRGETDIEKFGVSADRVLRSIEAGQGRIGIVILDACRNNPFAPAQKSRSLAAGGLARMDAPSGSLVAFSTAPGNVASDGTGRNGLYTKYLLVNVATPGITIEQVFKRTREGVERESGGEQSPREESSLKGDDFYFVAPGPVAPAQPVSSGDAVDLAFWDTIKDGHDAADFRAYLKQFPTGRFASLAQAELTRLSRRPADAPGRTGPVTLMVGERLPAFEARALDGAAISDKVLAARPGAILFFFSKGDCRTCLASLAALEAAAAHARPDALTVVAFGTGGAEPLAGLAQGAPANFHFVAADAALLKRLRIAESWPTTLVTGGGGEVVASVAGGAASPDAMLLAVADSLQQGGAGAAAKALYAAVGGAGVDAVIARAGEAYAMLHDGDVAGARAAFDALAAAPGRDAAARGKEGVAEVLLAQGDADGALHAADQALALFPNRAPAMLVKAKALVATGKVDDAQALIAAAGGDQAVADFGWQRAAVVVAQGNLLRRSAPAQAISAYQKARLDNPYAADALSNQGVVMMESGRAQDAFDLLKREQALDPGDRVAQALLRQAQDALAQQTDLARQKYIDGAVAELVTRYRELKGRKPAAADDWTSPPVVVSILDFKNSGAPEILGRIGMDKVFLQALSDQLQARHVAVVDRALLDKVMAELKLGSSDLADPDTQLKLGRILAARLIVTASLAELGGDKLVSLRAIDTETTSIALSSSQRQRQGFEPIGAAEGLAQSIAAMLAAKYPMRGRIVGTEADRVIINLGAKQGVAAGAQFNVLGKPEPIEFNGRLLGYKDSRIGELEVVDVQDLFSYARANGPAGAFAKNDRIIAKDAAKADAGSH